MAEFDAKPNAQGGAGQPAPPNDASYLLNPSLRVRRMISRYVYGSGHRPGDVSPPQRQAEVEAGRARPTLDELLAGSLFFKDDFHLELREFARIILKFKRLIISTLAGENGEPMRQMVDSFVLCKLEELFRELTRMMEGPSAISASSVEEEIFHIRETAEDRTYKLVFGNHTEFLPRLEFYRACAWSRENQLRVADRCMQKFSLMNKPAYNIKLFKAALGWMKPNIAENLSQAAGDNNKKNPLSPRAIQLAGAAMLSNLHNSIGSVSLAELFTTNDGFLTSLPRLETGNRPKLAAGRKPHDDDDDDVELVRPGLVVFEKINLDAARPDQKKQYERLLNKPLPLVQPPSLANARKVLASEFPHALSIIDAILRDIGMRRDPNGREYVAFKPVLLVGDAGIGKSQLARRLGEELGLAQTFYSCAGVSDSMFGGNSKHWNGSGPSVPVESIVTSGSANPLIIMDELDKTGTRNDHGRLQDVLLTMLEPSTAATTHDHFLSAPVNLTGVCWIATANSLNGISGPLKDRFRVMRFPNPSDSHLPTLAASLLCSIANERGLDGRWIEPLNGDEIEAVRSHWQTGSIRQLRRLIEAVLDAREEFLSLRMN